nr:putative reverse transcriptase domain-containing protein [Tanacetum cinerariifolium]
MSSPNHLTSNIEDAFSEYVLVVPDYSPASPGKTYSSASNNSTDVFPPTSSNFSLFHNDPYINIMNSYATFTPSPIPIPPPIIKPPSESPEFFLPKELLMPPKRSSTSEASTMSHDAIRNLVADSVATALKTQKATMAEADHSIREIPIAKRGNYKEFISLFSRSNCAEENKVAFATGTLTNDSLSWWNAYSQPIGIEQANRITWTELKRLLTNKSYAATPTENHGYTGNHLLCHRFTLHHTGPCIIRCRVCYKRKRHYQSQCPKMNINANRRTCLLRDKNAQQDPNVFTGMFLLNHRPARTLFDLGADRSFVSISFASMLNIPSITLDTTYNIKMADGNLISTNIVIQGCTLTLLNQPFEINLMSIKLGSFDVVIGMDWLSKYHAKIICDEKVIHIPVENETLIIRVMEKKSDKKRLENIPVVREFLDVFPEELPGLPPVHQVEFQIDLIPRAAPVARAPYRLAPSEMQEEIPVAKRGNYKEFISCQPFYLNGTKGVVRLIRWFERTESVFSRSNCAEENKVAFATGTLTNDALSLWNAYAQPIGIEQANKITWIELKRLLTNKRFQELAILCPNMVPNNEKLMEVFIGRLPRSIEGNVTTSKHQTLKEAINIAQRAAPVARAPYRLAHLEMQELSNQIQELADRGFIRLKAQTEALKEENMQAKNLRGMEKAFEIRTDGTRCIKNQSTQLDMSTTYHHETNRQSERTIQTLKDMLRACAIDFDKGWEKHLPLVEFSYNNSYHASIKVAPFEALYDRKFGSPVCWAEVGIIRFGKRGKLNPRYIRPFKILKRIGPVAYKLELHEELKNVHNTFHVSNLKKCLSDESLIIPMKELKLDDKLNFVEEPIEIIDREIKQLRQSRIPIIKIIWNTKRGTEYTWEREDEIRAKYPHLFPNNSLSSN